jgi:Asp-tRNA(Asn)/Glu-tRNA(Gln) amidotransferase A subunit family amidase
VAKLGLLFRSLSDVAALIRQRKVSPVEVSQAALDQFETLNPRLNALHTNLGEEALEAAKRAGQHLFAGRPCGPLHGVPLRLKDILRCGVSRRSPARRASAPEFLTMTPLLWPVSQTPALF